MKKFLCVILSIILLGTVTAPALSVSADSITDESTIRGDADPWTRLGYTYDWADNGTAYGLSEFIIFKGAKVKVECTYNLEEFAAYAMTQK